MISFQEIDDHNYHGIINLKVSESQRKFVSDNVKSLADCWLYREEGDIHPLAIYHHDVLIGFVLLEYEKETDYLFIWRLMIDQRYQNNGYGKQVMEKIISMAQSMKQVTKITSDIVVGNEVMKHLLESYGFREVEYIDSIHEIAYELTL